MACFCLMLVELHEFNMARNQLVGSRSSTHTQAAPN